MVIMKFIYFAWVREKIGKTEEEISLPDTVKTISDVLAFLKGRDEAYADALSKPELIRVALDHVHQEHNAPIAGAHEIALFPPMTGG